MIHHFPLIVMVIIPFLWSPLPLAAMQLQEAVSMALQTHPEIAAGNHRTTAARLRTKAAFAGYLPTLDARAATGFENADTPTTRGQTGDDEDLHREEFTLTLRQNLFDGFETSHLVATASEGAVSREHQARSEAEELGLTVIQAYLDVLRTQRAVALAQENVDNHQAIKYLVQQRVDGKVASRPEINQASARTIEAETDLFRAHGQLEETIASFYSWVGAVPESLIDPEPPVDMFSADRDTGIATSLETNPAVLRAAAEILRAKYNWQRRQAAFSPKVAAEFSLSRDRNLTGVPGSSHVAQAMLVMTCNLAAGGRDMYRSAEAYALLLAAQENLLSIRRQTTERTSIAYHNWMTAQSRRSAFESQVLENTLVKAAFLEQYRVGKRTLLDLLESEQELFRSKSNYLADLFQEKLAIYRILAVQGKLLTAIGVEPPPGARHDHMSTTFPPPGAF